MPYEFFSRPRQRTAYDLMRRLYSGQHCDEERLREKRPISQEMVIAHFCQQALNAETLLINVSPVPCCPRA